MFVYRTPLLRVVLLSEESTPHVLQQDGEEGKGEGGRRILPHLPPVLWRRSIKLFFSRVAESGKKCKWPELNGEAREIVIRKGLTVVLPAEWEAVSGKKSTTQLARCVPQKIFN